MKFKKKQILGTIAMKNKLSLCWPDQIFTGH
jgi:hypothetical protein